MKRRRLPVAAAMVALATALPCIAREKMQSPAATPVAMAERCLAAVQRGQVDGAVDALVATSPLMQAKPQDIEVLKNQTKSMLPLFGAMLGFEKVKEEAIGTSMVHLLFVARHEKHPIVWRFIFYRPKDQWYVSAFKWSDMFEGII